MDTLLGALAWIYIVVSQIMTIVFFVDICKDWDSILAIILFGLPVAELKGIFWIFLIW